MIPLGEIFLKLALGFLQSLPCVLFPFADFVLYPLAMINHSHEYNSMLSSVSNPSELLKLGMVLAKQQRTHIHICIHTHIYTHKYI